MAELRLSNGEIIKEYSTPYFVAEVNTSHYGKIETAKELIKSAKESGFNCVKFQSWSANSLYSKTYYDENPFAERMVKRFAFLPEQLKELSEYCRETGVEFSSTPYSKDEVDFLVDECKAPFVKVASMDLNNDVYLEYIALKNIPIVLSTGMSSFEEVKHALDILKTSGVNNICLLHCISVYPPKDEDIRLLNILGLREEFPDITIGFSDHSEGSEMAIAATALGVGLIEKHITLDKSKIGMDNQMAMEPEEAKNMITLCRNVSNAMGSKERIISGEELEQKEKMRRSLVATCNIKKGTVITEEMIGAKRPATGIPLDKRREIIGKVALEDIDADKVILYSNVDM